MSTNRCDSTWVRAVFAVVALFMSASCTGARVGPYFRVIPGLPDYLLQSPDSVTTPLEAILDPFQDTSEGWIELGPSMELRVEQAIFRDPEERTVANYVGLETVRYVVLPSGELQQIFLESLPNSDGRTVPRVEDLIPVEQLRLTQHRLFLQVIFDREGGTQGAVLLSAASMAVLERLTRDLIDDPKAACRPGSDFCTVFSEDSTAGPDIGVVVNGQPRSVPWTTRLRGIVREAESFELYRFHAGALTRVELDTNDPSALALFLLPGDHIRWR